MKIYYQKSGRKNKLSSYTYESFPLNATDSDLGDIMIRKSSTIQIVVYFNKTIFLVL